jgi:hypothetical protein
LHRRKNVIVPPGKFINIAPSCLLTYTVSMFDLTRQQQMFLCAVLFLLLAGWAVKAWRAGHPSPPPAATAAR